MFEAHNIPRRRSFMFRRLMKRNIKIIAITSELESGLISIGFVPKDILVAPDGVDAHVIEHEEREPGIPSAARAALGLPLDRPVVVYAGSLYPWKGVFCLADAAKLLPRMHIILVGGDAGADERSLKRYLRDNAIENVSITGYIRSENTIRTYLAAADVLVLPNTAKVEISKRFTSPLKLFMYMAARRPIVASDVPSLREVLSSRNAILVAPDDAHALAQGIQLAIGNRELSECIRQTAFSDVRGYTWEKRANLILNFIRQ